MLLRGKPSRRLSVGLSALGLVLLLVSAPHDAASQSSQSAVPLKSPVGIDFSYAGYKAGQPIPWVRAVLLVKPSGADDTALLQGALDRVAKMSVGNDGFRGAVLLARGRFHVNGQLHLNASGVVLRGSGIGAAGSVVVATGIDRRPLLVVGAWSDVPVDTPIAVDQDARAGALTLHLVTVSGLRPGMSVVVRRPSTENWIRAVSMTGLPGTFANQRLDWKAGSHDLVWDRTLVAVDARSNTIHLDAPITTALEGKYGGGTLSSVSDNTAPRQIGIEYLTLESNYDTNQPKDENHSWIAILLDHIQDAWVRTVTARYFVDSAVRVNLRGRRITLEGCRSEAPISERAGYRRQSFLLYGQQVLVHRCHSEQGMNDFASGLLAGGPNVFLDCDATGSLEASGAFEGWSSGVLYEHVRIPDARLQFVLDFSRAQGAGWTAANSLAWNSTAKSIDALGPPGAPNFVVNSPEPLYATELAARTGNPVPLHATVHRDDPRSLPQFRTADIQRMSVTPVTFHPVQIVNGRFVLDGKVLWGPSQTEAWWRGDPSIYTAAASTGSSVTRFMPGVIAPGETEDLQQLVCTLLRKGTLSFQVNPGLWYDHRRDSHTVDRRSTGDVWAPFYESPWARSGQGIAWDGLSRFDVSRYNPWYFQREREFALEASKAGLLVFYDLYNTHNVLEIEPHWIDYAWRPANNINDTGLPEPPPLRPDGRNDVGNQFYSTSYAPLRALHRAYILHTLDELGDLPNIIFGVAYQYAGPLSFQQFFQDTVREWEHRHGRTIRIALTTSKQTTDAILSDPIRSRQVAVVDMRYWEYRPDGSLFAPRAGENHAFRELISEAFPGYTDTPPPTTPQQVYREVREYRDLYPDKALMPMEDGAGAFPILMGGAASESALRSRPPAPPPSPLQQATAMYPLPTSPAESSSRIDTNAVLDRFVHTYLATDLMKMSPKDGWVAAPERTWVLAGGAAEPVLIYSLSGPAILLVTSLPAPTYHAIWFDPRTGATQEMPRASGAAWTQLTKPNDQDWALLLLPDKQ